MVTIKQQFDNDDHYVGGNTKEYIVVHGTGNITDSDEGNANYFCSGDRESSAHYFVDDDSITQIVKDDDCAWHCGDGGNAYGIGNRNSIGIEMCCTNSVYSVRTIANTIDLIIKLMKQYNIPLNKVVRHYDASRKNCPSGLNLDGKWTGWYNFKAQLNVAQTPIISTSTTSNIVYDIKYLQTQIGAEVDGYVGPQTLSMCPLLRLGSEGNVVKFLQSKIGAYPDGDFGNMTKLCVMSYQNKAFGLSGADGIVGQLTWRKILGL